MGAARNFLQNASGSAAVEMALVLPLLIVLLFATFEGGYMLLCEHKVIKGVRDAARYAGRLDFSDYSCPSATFVGPSTDLANIKSIARTGQLSGGTSYVPGWVDGDVTVSVNCVAGTGGIYGAVGNNAPQVTVSASVAYPSLFGILGFDTTGLRLNASAQSPVMGL